MSKIELIYEYFDKDRITYSTLITVEDTFDEFKAEWLEMWKAYENRSKFSDPNSLKQSSRWKKL